MSFTERSKLDVQWEACGGRVRPRIDSFKVVLGRGGVEIAGNRRWLTRTVAHDLDAHEQAIAVMIRREGSVTVADVRARLEIDSDEIRGAFQSLVDEGVLRRIGRDEVGLARTSRWSREEWRRNILGALSPSEPVYARRHSSPMAAMPAGTSGCSRQSGQVSAGSRDSLARGLTSPCRCARSRESWRLGVVHSKFSEQATGHARRSLNFE